MALKARDDLIDIAERDQRGVRIGAIDQHLQRCGFAAVERPGKACMNDNAHHRPTGIDIGLHGVLRGGTIDHIETPRGDEMGYQFATALASIQIQQ